MATVITSPMTGSAQIHPTATPAAPSSTARLVNPSARGVEPIGYEGSRADPAADPDTVARHQLIPSESNHCGQADRLKGE